jgi:hypothetical protein
MRIIKKPGAVLFAALIISAFGGCDFLMGPDEPVGSGGGSLSVSVGTGAHQTDGRAINSGAELPDDVRASLGYTLTLTGPGGETLERTLPDGENLKLTAALGEWRIDVQARQDGSEFIAGTGSLVFTVIPGINSVRIPMIMTGPCYTISVPEAANGTVEAGLSAAFPGTPVTLTATPDAGYILKSGTLTYSYAGGEGILEGNGSGYSFIMPAGDVTVHTGFNQELGFTIEDPSGDLMVPVTIVNSRDGTSSTDISWSGNDSLTFTVDAAYNTRFGNLKWLVNGEDVTGSGSSLIINAQDYIPRTYTLTAMIKAQEDNQWYSGNSTFTVKRTVESPDDEK